VVGPAVGSHAVELALAAIAVGSALGMHISEMLPGFDEPETQVRLLVTPGPNGSMMIDDTYNASTPSVLSALGLLAEMSPGRRSPSSGTCARWVTSATRRAPSRRAPFGGGGRRRGHLRRAGPRHRRGGRNRIGGSPTAGDLVVASFGLGERDQLLDHLRRELGEGDIVLLKGSRGLKMEEFVLALQTTPGGDAVLSS
jgi:UDP-N-acetylmuramoyl-tripeptide--D-alanyl-D-alanine ligase